jgi:hypothetical protein
MIPLNQRILALHVENQPLRYSLLLCPALPISFILLVLYFIVPFAWQTELFVAVYGTFFILSALSIPISFGYGLALFRRRQSLHFFTLTTVFCILAFITLLLTVLIGCGDAARAWM